MAKLTKFPVTAPDGTEYRVTIAEEEASTLSFEHAYVSLYEERKGLRLFRFKSIFSESYYDRDALIKRYGADSDYSNTPLLYSVKNPDYIALARQVVADYVSHTARLAEHRAKKAREESEQEHRVRDATEAFRNWDGKITENTEE